MTYRSNGGNGPSGLEPSQKQSIGVIQTQGMIWATISSMIWASTSLEVAGGGGLKQMSDKYHDLESKSPEFIAIPVTHSPNIWML